jgi:hypothetical protein
MERGEGNDSGRGWMSRGVDTLVEWSSANVNCEQHCLNVLLAADSSWMSYTDAGLCVLPVVGWRKCWGSDKKE